ncbi:DUF2017 domain-containing protein [Streptomyces sp. DSM 44915]|uniref:DUF2017 domain-containing protein n=1 Tax=Streptomyces chisholmiae TaxID=3075540 RepID=A0ABU2JSB7_9ACTN|nr:DUF2017 domain-containing protein [Streptomyces sp. DSM 44915]MDT0267880.1 DUF2017 domain-containing protein [Streptomyces sp. DSM 44915]
MSGYFEPAGGRDGGARVVLDEVEISILRSLAVQLLELIGPEETVAEDADPLAALFAEGPTEPPTDPALARLFPDAYVDPERGAGPEGRTRSAEFRRFTESDLRAQKRERLLAMVRDLDGAAARRPPGAEGAPLTLAGPAAETWLGGLNDLRLVIAARLDIEDESTTEKLFELPDEDPRKPMVMAFLWLGGLQESLVATLLP